MKNIIHYFTCLVMVVSIITFSGCGSDSDSPQSAEPKVLLIQQGALSVSPGATPQLTATLISPSGETDVTSKVEWSENSEEASFSGNTLNTGSAEGPFIVSATYKEDGVTYTAQAPVNVLMPSSVLVVAPAGILVYEGESTLQLNTFFLGKGSITGYEFSSSDASVASVDANGLVTFKKAGQCEITVKSKGVNPQQSAVVPVLVIGSLGTDVVAIPVTKITLTPSSDILFLSQETTFEAKAYNSKGEEVTPEGGFSWTMESLDVDTEDEEDAEPAGTLIPNGSQSKFKADKSYGRAKVSVTAAGVSAHAEVFVSPEFVMFVNPPMTSISAGASKQFALETYPVDKETMSLKETPVANPAGVKWMMLDFGFNEFSIGTVNATGNVTLKQDAMPGMIGMLMAYVDDNKYAPGFSMLSVAIASDCDCGTAENDAADISVLTSPITFSIMTGNTSTTRPAQIIDAQGNVIAGTAKYCSDNEQVVSVSDDGTINALQPGNATITVCHGSLTKQIAVTVNF